MNDYLKIVLRNIDFDLIGDILLLVYIISVSFYFYSKSHLLSYLGFLFFIIKIIGLKYGK